MMAWEAGMYNGLILLVFIGVFVAWFWTRGRRKLGLAVNGKQWLGAVIIFAVLMILVFGASHTPH
jgi:Mg/Co/Ni transporter MgtE